METSVGISSAVLDQVLAAAARSPTMEVCGLLFGDDAFIAAAIPCRNVAADPTHAFEVDPAALLAVHKAMRAGGPRLIGHYHSHPGGLPQPSPRDAAAANGGEYWLIIGGGQARLWRATAVGVWLERFVHVPVHPSAPCAPAPASP